MPHHAYRDQRRTCRTWFSPSIMWILGFRLCIKSCTYWAALLALLYCFKVVRPSLQSYMKFFFKIAFIETWNSNADKMWVLRLVCVCGGVSKDSSWWYDPVVECLLSMCETHHYSSLEYKQTKSPNTHNKNQIVTTKHNSFHIYVTLRKLCNFSKL